MHWVVVAYDISDDRTRTKFAKFLERFLDRVQKSVFEGRIREHDLHLIRRFANSIIDHETDSVRIYKLCKDCCTKTEVIGYEVPPSDRIADEVV